MTKDNIVGFRVSMMACDNPQEFYKEIKPIKYKSQAWIPQTLGDQIWMWFEFDNESEKKGYISWVEQCDIGVKSTWDKDVDYTKAKDMFMHNDEWLTQKEVTHWTQ